MDLEIKKASTYEAEIIYKILFLCGEHMRDHFGFNHWSPPYPIESIKNNIIERDVYLVFRENEPIATFTLGLSPLVAYDESRWEVKADQAMYLNRLAILPSLQGQNLGSWCMEKIESLARKANCQALRFDAVAKHNKLLNFYSRLKYNNLGLWQLQDTRGVLWDVVLFEKEL
ncbi:MAG: GNAT family N-acetyltransferase [Acidobacteria bacterium]|nr:GNAT family N-acetyltransferase [Acidobacteriota bacterium]